MAMMRRSLSRLHLPDPFTVDPVRAFASNLAHYTSVFAEGRDEYAIPPATPPGRRGPGRPEFLQSGTIETFRWLRVIGDTTFATGAVALALFIIGLRRGPATLRRPRVHTPHPLPMPGRL